jgi:hypothetical protein
LNVLGGNDIRQLEMHTAKPVVFETNFLEAEIAIEKLKR